MSLLVHQSSQAAWSDACKCRSFADSKTLTEEKRDVLFQEIAEDASLGAAVDVLDACTLSAQMLARYAGLHSAFMPPQQTPVQ